jgi:hypothetical protein
LKINNLQISAAAWCFLVGVKNKKAAVKKPSLDEMEMGLNKKRGQK